MTTHTIIQEPEQQSEYTAVQDPKPVLSEAETSDIRHPTSEIALAVLENSETGLVTIDTSAYAGRPIERDLVVEFGDTLMGVHPNAQEIGIRGMRTVAHLALITGAHPLPGTNGIHAWRDKKGYLCIQFGIGFWRQQGTLAGGILWISRPRPMTDEERAEYIIAEAQHASICIGALKRDVFALLHEAAEYNVTINFQDAKLEVARVGTGIVNPGEYDKNGRSPQWTANLRAERDLLRQLVPVISPGKLEPGNRDRDTTEQDPTLPLSLHSISTVHDPHPDRPQLPDDYTIEDANADLFD
jgi:hypothetical protein